MMRPTKTIFPKFNNGWQFPVARTVVVLMSLSALVGSVWSASLTRTTAYEYNAAGLMTKEIIEPGDPNLCVVNSHTYDNANGNELTSTTRNCDGSIGSSPGINDEASAPIGLLLFVNRSTTYTYTDDQRFVKTVGNALGYAETRTYDPVLDVVTKLTGPNGLSTEWQYDGWGRKTLEIQAYEAGAASTQGTQWSYQFCSGVNAGTYSCPSGIKGPRNAVDTGTGGAAKYVVVSTPVTIATATKSVTSVSGPVIKVYYDELNRPIRTETQGFDGNGTAQLVYKDTAYDTLGRVAYESKPYFAGATVVAWNYSKYDLLGRITRSEAPDDQGVMHARNISYSGLVTTEINAKLQQTVRRSNSLGQAISVTDHDGKVLVYTYDPSGNLIQTAFQGQEAITKTVMAYDLRGRKTSLVDPSLGTISYQYNSAGDLVKQTDAKLQVATTQYDQLGRMVQRIEPDLITNWYFDKNQDGTGCGKSIGKLCETRSDNGYNRKHTYDNLGRPATSINVIDGVTYNTSTGYDNATGRLASQTYPTGFSTKFVYTTLGYLKEIRKNDSSNTLYWQADSMDAEGHITQQTYGNNVQTTKVFNSYTGRINSISGGANAAVVNQAYTYDSIGNLLTRQDSNQSLSETFTMDMLNRISSANVNANATGWVTTSYVYDDQGNIICKSDLGACSATAPNITYNASAYNAQNQATRTIIHAVASVVGSVHGAVNPTYKYDLNGNMISGAGMTVSYTSFNMVNQITHPTKDGATYLYGSEHQRIREKILTAGTNAVKETTQYLHPDMTNGLFYERVVNASLKHRNYLTAGGEVVAMVEDNTTTLVTNTRYMHRDYQSSVIAVTNEIGTVLERYAFDAFGKRRYPNGTTDPQDAIRAAFTDRGYTNHEHLDALGLINMNGRFYDPSLGRFMSADPYIPYQDNLQSYNRYSYVRNNPLTMGDPSGYFDWFGFGSSDCYICISTTVNANNSGYNIGVTANVGGGSSTYIPPAKPSVSTVSSSSQGAPLVTINSVSGSSFISYEVTLNFSKWRSFYDDTQSTVQGFNFGLGNQPYSVLDIPTAKWESTSFQQGYKFGDDVRSFSGYATIGLEAAMSIPAWPVRGTLILGEAVVAARGVAAESRALTSYHPPNNGAFGESAPFTLLPGARVDRYGRDAGRYLSPEGTPMQMRALAPTDAPRAYSAFEVQTPFTVQAGTIAPAYGQPGLGLQFYTDRSVGDLVRGRYLTRVKP